MEPTLNYLFSTYKQEAPDGACATREFLINELIPRPGIVAKTPHALGLGAGRSCSA